MPYSEKALALRKDRITSHRLMMKIGTRAATKMFVATFTQKRLALIVDRRRRNRREGDNLNGDIRTTNSRKNNQNENQEYL